MFLPADVLYVFPYALYCASALAISHTAACLFVAWMDFSGRWQAYALEKDRKVTWETYVRGLQSFFANSIVLFIPIVTVVLALRREAILNSTDPWWLAAGKLFVGYTLGKLWAFAAHYILHMKPLYFIHKAHHPRANTLVASQAWLDSWLEYLVMEIPSFCIMMLLLPTHFAVHLAFFCWHGIGAAGDHSGFRPPGVLGYIFDGEYHYQHHKYYTVNYAEMEFLDKFFGTHHEQRWSSGKAVPKSARREPTDSTKAAS